MATTIISNHTSIQDNSKSGCEVDEARAKLFGKHLLREDCLSAAFASLFPVLWDSPLQWLEDNKNILHNRQDIVSTKIPEIIRDTLVHPRLLFYVFNTLMEYKELLPEIHVIIESFHAAFATWESCIPLACLVNWRQMRNDLLSFVSCLNEVGTQILSQDSLSHILALDNLAICVYLFHFLSDRHDYRSFTLVTGKAAQNLLDLVQELLDYVDLDYAPRRRFLQALLRLSQQARLYPQCLVLPQLDERDEDPISWGSFGDVYCGRIKGEKVAVKLIRRYQVSNLDKLLKDFSREAVLWRQLSHPNLLPFYGVYRYKQDGSRICMVSPWMENGSIRSYLKRYPEVCRILLVDNIISGLEYLHIMDPCIVHGDLKGENILIDGAHKACIADFGLSSADPESFMLSMTESHLGGTLRWQAPELMDHENSTLRSTPNSDIYSFASVCYEIFTDDIPYSGMHNGAVIQAIRDNKQPSRPDEQTAAKTGLTDDIWDLMLSCWQLVPSKRPNASQIRDYIISRKSQSSSTSSQVEAEKIKEQGNMAFRAKRYGEAIDLYTRAIELYGSEPVYYTNRAASNMAIKHFRNALADCQTAAGLQAKTPSAKTLVRLARCQLALGLPTPALSTLRGALSVEPNNIAALALQKKVLELEMRLHNFESARSKKEWDIARLTLDKCLQGIEGEGEEIPLEWRLWGVELELARGNWNAANIAINEAMRSSLGLLSPDVLTLQGLILFLSSKLSHALQHVQEALRLDPGHESAQRLRRRIKDVERVKNEGNRAFGSRSYTTALEKYNDALQRIGQAEEEGKGGQIRATLLLNRATTLLKMHRFEEALRDISELLDLQPKSFNALRIRGRIHMHLEKYKNAVADFESALGIAKDGDVSEVNVIREEITRIKDGLEDSNLYKHLGFSQGVIMTEFYKEYQRESLKLWEDMTIMS